MKNTSDNRPTPVSNSLRQIFSASTIVCLVIFGIITIYSTFVDSSYYSDTPSILFQSLKTAANSNSPYYVLYVNYSNEYVGMITGFLLGLFQFAFLSDKNACYTRLSFGLKRKSLFLSNCFYPVIIATFIIFITKLISAIANIYYVGLHFNIIKIFVVSVLSAIVPLLFAFTITAIANVITSRKLESVLLIAAVTSLPYAIFSIICYLFSATVYGYGNYAFYDNEIFDTLSRLDPTQIFLMEPDIEYFTCGVTEKLPLAKEIIWCSLCIGACIGALLWTANHFEKRFKPENCGKKGVSKFSLTVISFAASSSMIAAVLENTSYDYTMSTTDPLTRILLSAALGIIVAVVINLLVMLGKKRLKYGFLGAGISVVIQLIIIIIGLTGCFGFSTNIPDPQSVSSIEILIPFSDMFRNDLNDYFSDSCGYDYLGITDYEDFQTVQSIHKTALETKGQEETSLSCEIKYTLKNGKTVSRYYYNISEETATQYLKLWDTKAAKNYYKVKLNQGKPEKTTRDTEILDDRFDFYLEDKPIPLSDYLIIVSKDNRMTELSPSGNAPTFAPTEEIMLEIMGALYKDICTLSAEEWFMPEEQYGALVFDSGARSIATNSYLLFEDVFNEQNTVFYINSNMKNTVNVLKKYDYLRFFDCFKNVEKAHIVTSDNLAKYLQAFNSVYVSPSQEYVYKDMPLRHSTYYTINNYNREDYLIYGCEYTTSNPHDILGYPYDEEIYDSIYPADITTIDPPPQKEISPTEAKKLIKKSFMAYNLGNSGEFLVVKYAGGSCIILALPE